MRRSPIDLVNGDEGNQPRFAFPAQSFPVGSSPELSASSAIAVAFSSTWLVLKKTSSNA